MVIWLLKIFFCIVLCILDTFSYYLLLLLGPYHFFIYCAHLFMSFPFGISSFLEEIYSLFQSIVFLYFFALIAEEGFLISPCYSLTLNSNGYNFPFLLCFSLLFFSQLFVRLPQITILPFCISFSWGWSWSLPPVPCHEPPSIVFQALCLSEIIPWIYFSLPLFNCKGFDLGHTWMV